MKRITPIESYALCDKLSRAFDRMMEVTPMAAGSDWSWELGGLIVDVYNARNGHPTWLDGVTPVSW